MIKVDDLGYSILEFPLEMDSFYKDPEVLSYLQEIKKYKSVDKKEENYLLENREFEKVFHANLYTVALIAGRYSLLTKSIYPMDLIQEANLGLLEAIRTYKKGVYNNFNQYMRLVVSRKLVKMIKEQGKMFEVSPLEYEKIIDYIKLLELNELLYDGKFNETLADAWGKFEDKHYQSYGFIDYKEMDRDIINMQNAIENVVSIETLDKRKPIGTYDIENDINIMSIKLELIKAIKSVNLTKEEKTILYYSFIVDQTKTVKEIAKILNLNTMKVSKLRDDALKKLKGYLLTKNQIEEDKMMKIH